MDKLFECKIQAKHVSCLLLALMLSACSGIKKLNPWHTNNDVEAISVYVEPDPALRHAVSIDVLFVYSEKALTAIGNLTATDWFSQKRGLMANYSHELSVLSWQIVKNYTGVSKTLPTDHADAIAVLAFAFYPANPNAKAILTELETPWLVFSKGRLKAVTEPPLLQSVTIQE